MVPSHWFVYRTKRGRVTTANLILPGMTVKVVPHPKDDYFTVELVVDNLPVIVGDDEFRGRPVVSHTFIVAYHQRVVFKFIDCEELVGVGDDLGRRCAEVLRGVIVGRGDEFIQLITLNANSDLFERFKEKFRGSTGGVLELDVDGVDARVVRDKNFRVGVHRVSVDVIGSAGGLTDELTLTVRYHIPFEVVLTFPSGSGWLDVGYLWVKGISDVYERVTSGELLPRDRDGLVSLCGVLGDDDFKSWFSDMFIWWLKGVVGIGEGCWDLVRRWLERTEVRVVSDEVGDVVQFSPWGSFPVIKAFKVSMTFPYRRYEELLIPLIDKEDTVGFLTFLLLLFNFEKSFGEVFGSAGGANTRKNVLLSLINLYVTGGLR